MLAGGALAPLFVVTFLIEGVTRAGYSPMRDFVSALSLGDHGWVQIANFLVAGVLLLAFAAGLGRVAWPGRPSAPARALLVLFALAHLAAGVFVTGPSGDYPPGAPTTASPALHALLHSAAALVIFTSLPAACVLLAPRFARDPAWRRWAPGSRAAGVVVLLFFLTSLAATHAAGRVASLAGLFQRVAIATAFTWIALLSVRLVRAATTTPVRPLPERGAGGGAAGPR